MDERRRRDYLAVMGVSIWTLRPGLERRGVTSSTEEASPEPPVIAEAFETCGEEEGVEPAASPPGASSDPAGMGWEELEATVAACRACGLCDTRTQTVFGVGNRQARLLVIGEAPGADEDRVGEPFVGRAGKLLNRMLAAIGCPRETVYIANVLKCRPPGNRDPRPEESLRCQAFLLRQLQLIQPELILAVGRIAAQHLLQTDESVGRLRGRWWEFGPERIPVRVTYHPAYLLRSPEQKAKAWEDLTILRRRLDAASGV